MDYRADLLSRDPQDGHYEKLKAFVAPVAHESDAVSKDPAALEVAEPAGAPLPPSRRLAPPGTDLSGPAARAFGWPPERPTQVELARDQFPGIRYEGTATCGLSPTRNPSGGSRRGRRRTRPAARPLRCCRGRRRSARPPPKARRPEAAAGRRPTRRGGGN